MKKTNKFNINNNKNLHKSHNLNQICIKSIYPLTLSFKWYLVKKT